MKLLVIVGPTSSGKSALAVRLAHIFGGEVISADSRQLYRGLDIGTGKITASEMKGVRHHLLDIASPKRTVTAHAFALRARAAAEHISALGRLPIVCGGTGFYIDAMLGRITLPDIPPDKRLRKILERRSVRELFNRLQKKDPRRANRMNRSDRNNKVRLVRALEIALSPARTTRTEVRPRYDVLWIGIAPEQNTLERKISQRLDARMRLGMLREARRLHKGGLSFARIHALGLEYRFLAAQLQGRLARKDMLEGLFRAIRQYAKRQVRYWKRNPDIRWFSSAADRDIERTVKAWLTTPAIDRWRAKAVRARTKRRYR